MHDSHGGIWVKMPYTQVHVSMTSKKGLAKPDYQKVIDLLEGKADRDNSENTMLKYSYHYMMSNAFIYGKNKALAKEYADKILTIDPEYAPAQQIKELK